MFSDRHIFYIQPPTETLVARNTFKNYERAGMPNLTADYADNPKMEKIGPTIGEAVAGPARTFSWEGNALPYRIRVIRGSGRFRKMEFTSLKPRNS
jgi:hypothetical protein